MSSGRLKSRTMRRVKRVTPGGNTVTHYEKRSPGSAKCTACGAVLPGTPRARPVKMQNMPKTTKRPERAYGGVLCTRCSRAKIKTIARN